MESRQEPVQPARRTTAPTRSEAERRQEERDAHEAANKEKVEAMAAPETPTPTQEEADDLKEGALAGANALEGTDRTAARQQRDQRPASQASGYQTR